VAAVDENASPPPELRLGWNCERWQTLPDAGGIHDQEYQLVQSMNASLNVYHALRKYRNAKGAEIHNLNDQERSILHALMTEDIWHG
jgi:hypothetical protein